MELFNAVYSSRAVPQAMTFGSKIFVETYSMYVHCVLCHPRKVFVSIVSSEA